MAASPLVYPTGDFVPFTKILSSEVNGKFNAITTLLNVTKLSDTNLQDHGISWGKLTLQAATQVAVTDTLGQLTVMTALSVGNGGTGIVVVPASQQAGDVLQINPSLTGFIVGAPTAVPAPSRIFNFYRFV